MVRIFVSLLGATLALSSLAGARPMAGNEALSARQTNDCVDSPAGCYGGINNPTAPPPSAPAPGGPPPPAPPAPTAESVADPNPSGIVVDGCEDSGPGCYGGIADLKTAPLTTRQDPDCADSAAGCFNNGNSGAPPSAPAPGGPPPPAPPAPYVSPLPVLCVTPLIDYCSDGAELPRATLLLTPLVPPPMTVRTPRKDVSAEAVLPARPVRRRPHLPLLPPPPRPPA
ncbi:hypothetical protein BOTBODRAFT_588767 [Botryobasidium botryosum FD-172 SS1]|uniref:Hydrophobin n=1 Tax=Botryobasidium botryosum (strain FD-172 SS1) TaxID=930990 RepID=A0A067LX16_BOTB1|nr:hypothetical protein BOTBODRAFT_588767 [Botryobasidium botryosum FD-172 SS1]